MDLIRQKKTAVLVIAFAVLIGMLFAPTCESFAATNGSGTTVAPKKVTGEDGLPLPPYAVYNIGGGQPENLLDYVSTLQEELVRAGVLPADYDFEGHRELVGMQAGDVPITYADSEALERDYGFTPRIGIREGLRAFAEWYKEYYKT